jgi:homoserine dehydrogenase
MSKKTLNIGLFGLGCVGSGLYEVLQNTSVRASIKKICIKNKEKKRSIPNEYLTFDKNDILNDKTINTVVELIDDAEEAYKIVKTALLKGKAVVTANKKMLAEHFEELLILQKKHNVPLLYEGACCASIPIIRNLEEYYDNDLLESVEGIVNGSTNYILTKITTENTSYQTALKEAQIHGFAETNPVLDTGGFDAKFKLLILLAHAFGLVVKPGDIFHLGIDKLGELEFNYAREKGYKIKLVAYAEKTVEGKIIAFVLPKFIKNTDTLFFVDDVFNGVKTKSYWSDVQFFSGKGAGSYPTASAVLSDISALSYEYRYEYKKLNPKESLSDENTVFLKVLLRHSIQDNAVIRQYFEEIYEQYSNQTVQFVIGKISLNNIRTINTYYAHHEPSFILFDVVKNPDYVVQKHINNGFATMS